MDGRFMRNSSLTLLILAILANAATANDEIRRLLADLSFGDVSSTEDKVPVSKYVEPIKVEQAELEPVAEGMKMPALAENLTPVTVVAVPPKPTVKTALQEPIPALSQPEDDLMDISQALPELIVTVPAETKSVGHRQNQACHVPAYETGIVCRPRVSPNLPTSTFLQYFRGNPCYSNAWQGYHWNCGPHHAHLHGECECFMGKGSGCESCDAKSGR